MMKYNTIFYYSQDDQCFVTVVPRLPGCMSDGETIEEALANTQIIIEEWLQDAREEGEPVPSPDAESLEQSGCSIKDVSGYILSKTGPITAMMLEKLTYYTLAWSLAWYKTPLFAEHFQAWRDGPVCPELFKEHHGKRIVSSQLFSNTHTFSASEQAIIDSVISAYGTHDAEWLSDLTHNESPWQITRGGLGRKERSKEVIPEKLMLEYYGRVSA